MRSNKRPHGSNSARHQGPLLLWLALAAAPAIAVLPQDPPASAPAAIEPREALVIRGVVQTGRVPFPRDVVYTQRIHADWRAPQAGDTLTGPDGSPRTWEMLAAAEDGEFRHAALQGGYALIRVTPPHPGVWTLEARGHSLVLVNGLPRTGDPYSFGTARLPVRLEEGENELLFLCGRGRLAVRLTPAPSEVAISDADRTLPTLAAGAMNQHHAAVLLTNPAEQTAASLTLVCTSADGRTVESQVATIPPLSIWKAPFQLASQPPADAREHRFELKLRDASGRTLSSSELTLAVRQPGERYQQTFVSDIDGSVQYYAVLPPRDAAKTDATRALVLSLHGAGVEAVGQADSYSPKPWAWIVCPTNRRPFGFDWEDWGRLDALEVLAHASSTLPHDPRRVFLTGHSMGGHGTWHLGVTFPERFAAIGPSAGWLTFATYAGGRPAEGETPIDRLLQRAAGPSDTLALTANLAISGIYLLDGEADDVVPVAQARRMREELEKFHRDFRWHEQPGAGHWWDASDEPGADCVDWGPMFEFFARRRTAGPGELRTVDFTTMSPAISARCGWLEIEQQVRSLSPSRVRGQFDPGQRRFRLSTENVARLSINISMLPAGEPVRVEIDDATSIAAPWPGGDAAATHLHLRREGDAWTLSDATDANQKTPRRSGLFKEAFRNRAILVYGTAGTAEENAWALAKARCDAETFWYRGNGAFEVIADNAFDPAATPDRNVILYGHRDMNRAWPLLLSDSPIQIGRGAATVDGKAVAGEALAALFIRPRPGSAIASVGVVAGVDLPGLRVTERIPWFVSGVAYPDVVLCTNDVLTRGAAGIRLAGFFGNDWSVSGGEMIWNDGDPSPVPGAESRPAP